MFKRPVSRLLARELNAEERAEVGGGGCRPGQYSTICDAGDTLSGGMDDQGAPDDFNSAPDDC